MALRFLITGGTGNFNSTSNWAATSGGASGATAPLVTDDVVFDNNSHNTNLTINVSSACLSFSASNSYAGTLTMTNQLAVSGSTTLATGMTITGAGTLLINGTGTLTSNGKAWPTPLTFSINSTTKTLNDNWYVNGLFTSLTTTQTVNSPGSLVINSGMTISGTMAGTAPVVLQSGTWSGAATIGNPLTFSGNSILGASLTYGAAGSPVMSYSAGTVTTAGSTLTISVNATINASAVTFSNIALNTTGGIVTLNNHLNLNGTLSSGAAVTTTINGAFNVNVSGSVSIGTNWAGTSTLNYTGNGNFSGASAASILIMPTIINTTGATFNSFVYRTNVLTFTNVGNSTWASNAILLLNTNPTLMVNCTGVTFQTVQVGGNSSSAIFSGTNGFTMGTYTCNAGSASKSTWQSGNTYTITSLISANTTSALAHVWASSTPGQQYTMTLAQGCVCDVLFASITDADSSQGRTGWNNKGTNSNTVNWNLLPSSPTMIASVY